MADVRTTRDRGQLILVTGVVLAVALVGLALVLNSVIFTENLATRNNEQQSNGMLSERANAKSNFDEGITKVNDEVVTSTEFHWLRENLSEVVETREDRMARQAAISGGAVNYSVTSATSGTRIRQTNASRNFTAGDDMVGADDWVVVDNANNVRHFRISSNRSSLYESTIDTTKAALADSAFNVNVTDASGDTWKVYVFRGALTNNVYLLVEDPSDPDFTSSTEGYKEFVTEACTYQNETVTIWLTEAVVQNSECDQLKFFQNDAVRPLTIRYDNAYDESANAARIRGTYDLLVDKELSRSPSPYYLTSEGKSPFTQKAIVNAHVQMEYQSRQVEYYTDIETQPNGLAPTFVRHNPHVENWVLVDDQSTSTEVEYVMDWSVSDEDGDLDEVELILSENTAGLALDRETIDVSGKSASGTTTLRYTGTSLLSIEHRIEIVVEDEEDGVDSEVIIDEADGNP